jgi:hypothetical protein
MQGRVFQTKYGGRLYNAAVAFPLTPHYAWVSLADRSPIRGRYLPVTLPSPSSTCWRGNSMYSRPLPSIDHRSKLLSVGRAIHWSWAQPYGSCLWAVCSFQVSQETNHRWCTGSMIWSKRLTVPTRVRSTVGTPFHADQSSRLFNPEAAKA